MTNFLTFCYSISIGADLNITVPENILVLGLKPLYPECSTYNLKIGYDTCEPSRNTRLQLLGSDVNPYINTSECLKLLQTRFENKLVKVGDDLSIVEQHLNLYQIYTPYKKIEPEPPTEAEIKAITNELNLKLNELHNTARDIAYAKTSVIDKLSLELEDFEQHVNYHKFMFDEKIKKCNLKFTPEEKERVFATWPVETIPLYDLMYSFIHQLYDV